MSDSYTSTVLSWWLSNKNPAYQYKGWGLDSLDQEDPLEKEMATHSSTLALEIPLTEELGGLQSMGLQESDTT